MRRSDNEPLLFDLPLDRPSRDNAAEPQPDREARRSPRPPRQAAEAQPEIAGLEPPPPTPRTAQPAGRPRGAATPPAAPAPDRDHTPTDTTAAREERAGIGRRLAAGFADLLVHLAVAVLAFAGCRYLGVTPVWQDWPAGTVFLLSFSFLYTVVPLAFWGHTLGMTWAGLSSQSSDGEPLSFDQTARRWLGMILTLATLGLPLLLAFGGRSLTDRLSDSRTFPSA
jgi:uncharacterized RDD family membrane protein YckC